MYIRTYTSVQVSRGRGSLSGLTICYPESIREYQKNYARIRDLINNFHAKNAAHACGAVDRLSHLPLCGQAVKVWRLTAREEIEGEQPLFWYKIYSFLYFCWTMRQLRSVARGHLGSYVIAGSTRCTSHRI